MFRLSRSKLLQEPSIIELPTSLFAVQSNGRQQSKKAYLVADLFTLAGVRRIELRSKVLETFILTVVLHPYVTQLKLRNI